MINYKWTFSAFDCKLDEQLDKVVTTVHWRYRGTDEDGITAETYGAQSVGQPNPDAFTPYPQISEEQVIGWMEANMDVEVMNQTIANQINSIKNPTKVKLKAPWNTPVVGEEIGEEVVLDTEE
jgi:hypothetical protein